MRVEGENAHNVLQKTLSKESFVSKIPGSKQQEDQSIWVQIQTL